MNVLEEILNWSESRPLWQRDALRRIIQKGVLEESDIKDLVDQCKCAHGLTERISSFPLEETHIPKTNISQDKISLISLKHHAGVNALAANQKLEFGPYLTVVYGKNAAGKSGYTRILKSACRARGSEEILGNVLSQNEHTNPSATIEYKIGESSKEVHWIGEDSPDAQLSKISVFDSHCAAVYLKDKTDVAFRPFGLDLFDKLSNCCEQVRQALEVERRALNGTKFRIALPEGTEAEQMINEITSLSDKDHFRDFATLSMDESRHLQQLERKLSDSKSKDPIKSSQNLKLKSKRFRSFIEKLETTQKVISPKVKDDLQNLSTEILEAEKVLGEIESETFSLNRLNGIGSDKWKELWESAREYSKLAYPKIEFPVVAELCLLCQQEIGEEAAKRLSGFEKAIKSTAQQELEKLKSSYSSQLKDVEDLEIFSEEINQLVEEIQIDDPELGKDIQGKLRLLLENKQILLSADSTSNHAEAFRDINMPIELLFAHTKLLEQRAEQLTKNKTQLSIKEMETEINELRGRKILGQNIELVYDKIERKKKIAAYALCLNDVLTTGITRKSSEVTKEVVTKSLSRTFKDELNKLDFKHLDVEVQPSGASRGSLFHKLVIKRAEHADLPSIVSEGEARALSIAAFFSELSTATNLSAILFDDPVSSLDHHWREKVASRLVNEAKDRQVIIFTHDIVFLTTIVGVAKETGIRCDHQYLRQGPNGAGISSPELPWVAMKVKERLGVLKNEYQRIEKLERNGEVEQYEKEAIYLYGRLREVWERALEEILINGAVERYRPGIQTQQVKTLADITEDDCKILESGMTKCSKWLHDNAPAENVTVPVASEFLNDILTLESWMKTINKRRN